MTEDYSTQGRGLPLRHECPAPPMGAIGQLWRCECGQLWCSYSDNVAWVGWAPAGFWARVRARIGKR